MAVNLMILPYATRRSWFGHRAFNSASGLVEYGIAQPLAISLHTARSSNTAIEFYYYICQYLYQEDEEYYYLLDRLLGITTQLKRIFQYYLTIY